MSNAAIEAKFLANATPVITADRAARATEYVWSLEKQTNVASCSTSSRERTLEAALGLVCHSCSRVFLCAGAIFEEQPHAK